MYFGLFKYIITYSSIVENKNFHKQAEDGDIPYLYSILSVTSNTVMQFAYKIFHEYF